jgi:ditrans,polycis-polyprenyl diphosphate synthase
MLKFLKEKFSNFSIRLFSKILEIGGHIPKSIAIIMDGNRRYAQKKKLIKIQGHEDGLTTLLNVLLWSIELKIKEVTVFAFSIDNFNRPKDEINSLMTLAKEKFTKLSEKEDYFNQYGVQVCFYGNRSFIKDEALVKVLNDVEEKTKKNNNIKLNVCFPYNSTEEIFSAVEKSHLQLQNSNDFSFEDYKNILESNLYGGYNTNPEVLIRTSGEIRLSNFLLYQTRFSKIYFIDKFWPEFSFRDLFYILMMYNVDYKSHLRKIKELEEINNFKISNNTF